MEVTEIVLSKGIYHLIKDHLKKDKKLTDLNREQLTRELKSATVVPAKSFPKNVVAINTKVKVRDTDTKEELVFELVAPHEAKIKNNKLSVLSSLGLALIGYNTGDEVRWEMEDGIKRYRIEDVEPA